VSVSNPQSAVYFLGLFVFFSSHLSQFLCFLKLDFTITDFGYAGSVAGGGTKSVIRYHHHPLLAATRGGGGTKCTLFSSS
jgi:hypothetical protein